MWSRLLRYGFFWGATKLDIIKQHKIFTQYEIIQNLFSKLTTCIQKDIGNYRDLIKQSYEDLLPSLKLSDLEIPTYSEVEESFCDAIIGEHYKPVVVNSSEKDIEALQTKVENYQGMCLLQFLSVGKF